MLLILSLISSLFILSECLVHKDENSYVFDEKYNSFFVRFVIPRVFRFFEITFCIIFWSFLWYLSWFFFISIFCVFLIFLFYLYFIKHHPWQTQEEYQTLWNNDRLDRLSGMSPALRHWDLNVDAQLFFQNDISNIFIYLFFTPVLIVLDKGEKMVQDTYVAAYWYYSKLHFFACRDCCAYFEMFDIHNYFQWLTIFISLYRFCVCWLIILVSTILYFTTSMFTEVEFGVVLFVILYTTVACCLVQCVWIYLNDEEVLHVGYLADGAFDAISAWRADNYLMAQSLKNINSDLVTDSFEGHTQSLQQWLALKDFVTNNVPYLMESEFGEKFKSLQ